MRCHIKDCKNIAIGSYFPHSDNDPTEIRTKTIEEISYWNGKRVANWSSLVDGVSLCALHKKYYRICGGCNRADCICD
jgi:hypothetical protein